MLNDATPSFRELLLNRLTPPDDRDHVRVIVRLKQRETLTVVESAIKVDGLDPGVKAVEDTEELSEDTICGIAVFETAYRQRRSVCSSHARRVWHRRGTQWFHASLPSDRGRLCRLRHRRAAGGVCADLHLFGEQFIEILSQERVSDSFELFRLELRPKMVEDRVPSG